MRFPTGPLVFFISRAITVKIHAMERPHVQHRERPVQILLIACIFLIALHRYTSQ